MKKLPLDAQAYLTVYSSKNYDAFRILNGNRRVNQAHLKRLVESFQNRQLISPIIVNHKMQIIDGQHRFFAAKQLNLPVYFMVLEGYDLEEIQILNTNGLNWNKVNYLKSYCDLGYQDYIEMQEFMEKYPDLGISVSIMLLTNNTQGANQKNAQGFKKKTFQEGKFKVNNLKQAYSNAEKIMQFKPLYDGFNRQSFVAALLGIFKNKAYVQEEMITKLSKNPSQLVDCTTISNYRLLLEEIYNFRRREKVNLRY